MIQNNKRSMLFMQEYGNNNYAIIQRDMKNYFNNLKREHIFYLFKTYVPQMYPYIYSMYGQKNKLYMQYDDHATLYEMGDGLFQGEIISGYASCVVEWYVNNLVIEKCKQ